MNLAVMLAAIIGWTVMFTRADGPFGVLRRIRAAWPGGPLRCPLCTGTWAGLIIGALTFAAERWPCLNLIVWAGAGAAAAELYDVATDALRQRAFRDRIEADNIPQDPPRG